MSSKAHIRNSPRRKLPALWAGTHERTGSKAAEVQQQYRKIQIWADQAKLKQLSESVSGLMVQVMDPGQAGQGH